MHQTRRSWGSLFHTVRAPAVLLAGTLLVLLLAPESQDMMSGLWDAGLLHGATAYAALLFLGISAWHWSRAALSAHFEVPSNGGRRTLAAAVDPVAFDLVPRLMFLAVVGVGLVLAWRSQGGERLALPLVLAGAAGFAILTYRRRLPRAIGGGDRSLAGTRAQRQEPPWLRRVPPFIRKLLTYAPLGPHFAAAMLGGALIFFAFGAAGSLVMIDHTRAYLPVFVGRLFPGPGAALLCLAFAIAPLAALTFWADGWTWACTPFGLALRARWFPILIIPILIVWKTPVWFALHRVRIYEPPGSASAAALRPEDRPRLQRLLDRWAEACPPGADKSVPLRPVIVAVSGGASRAALWGARVLTMADDMARANGTGVFAVSSVSGGSVGAAAYMAWLRGASAPPCAPLGENAFRQDVMMASLKSDALGPLLAGALFGDIPRALMSVVLLPIHALDRSVTGLARGGDRADALEVAFEENWQDAVAHADPALKTTPVGLDSAYLALNHNAPGQAGTLPIWIANGTDQQNGERLLTVPFQANPARLPIGPGGGMQADWPFEGAKDVLGVLHADMPMSTVIDNTCRFPLLSPVGELTPIPDTSGRTVKHPMQIIDGGYFENEGALTAWELADWLRLHKGDGHPVVPILVQATADAADTPGLPDLDRQIPRCTGPFRDNPLDDIGKARADQVSAPLQGLLGIRGGHSGWVLRRVVDEYCTPAQHFFNFYLYRDYQHDRSVPLNWTLSDATARFIWNDAIEEGRNPAEQGGFARALSAPANAGDATPRP
jgi:hypothetical protein